MPNLIRHPAAARAAGVSLIEVLVALVVLTLGILSVMALQIIAKRNNLDSLQHALAAQYANALLDQMRVNNTQAALDAYVATAATGIGRAQQGGTEPTCVDTCTPEELAEIDIWRFEQLLDGAAESSGGVAAGGLVQPTACITRVESPGVVSGASYTITVVWRGAKELTDQGSAQPCGLGEAGDIYGPNDEYRRSLSISGYIANFS